MNTTTFHFWMDMRYFKSPSRRLTGAEIKAIANTSPLYPVYRDTFQHPTHDKAIGDGQLVDVDGLHFYSLIPATAHPTGMR